MQYFIIITAIQYLAGTHTCPFLLNVSFYYTGSEVSTL